MVVLTPEKTVFTIKHDPTSLGVVYAVAYEMNLEIRHDKLTQKYSDFVDTFLSNVLRTQHLN